MTRRELLRRARRDGWEISYTGSGHIRLRHSMAAEMVIISHSPRAKNGCVKDLSRMRRALRQGGQEAQP